MQIVNGQLKLVIDATSSQDAITMQQMLATLTIYKNGVIKTNPKFYYSSAVVAGGVVTFYLTDNGGSTGNALFTNIDKESFSWWVDDASNQYQLGSYALAANKKSITLTVNKLGTVLLGIVQLISAANGVTVNLGIWGD